MAAVPAARPRPTGGFSACCGRVAAWREAAAQQRDLPRGRIMRDEAVIEIAAHAPKTIEQLARTRSLGKGVAEGKLGQRNPRRGRRRASADPDPPPAIAGKAEPPPGLGPLIELLRVLLKQRCEDFAGRAEADRVGRRSRSDRRR